MLLTGKPVERRGRKATGLRFEVNAMRGPGHDSGVARMYNSNISVLRPPQFCSSTQTGARIVANHVAGSALVQGGCERIVVPPVEAGRLGREREKVVNK